MPRVHFSIELSEGVIAGSSFYLENMMICRMDSYRKSMTAPVNILVIVLPRITDSLVICQMQIGFLALHQVNIHPVDIGKTMAPTRYTQIVAVNLPISFCILSRGVLPYFSNRYFWRTWGYFLWSTSDINISIGRT